MKKLILAVIFIPVFSFAQSGGVGIGTEDPTAKLDIVGDLRIRQIPNGAISDSVLVVNNGKVRKIPVSYLNSGKCPNFLKNESDGYHIKFSSPASVPNPTNTLNIQGKNFTPAGSSISSNTYFYSWSNTTGQPINIQNVTIDFSGLICNYQ